ncbi:MAG: MerR family transcriptional regulator [Actinomycetota bacterium]|nr:MerR family transcriptional regulator [Actinomycetota bacterium]
MPTTRPEPLPERWTVDNLARRAELTVRTIRDYQTMGLLPPPEKHGRIGIYGAIHLSRLLLIGRLQNRGYSLAGIRDMLSSWSDGAELGEVLGLAPDELVHIDEPGRPATVDQLTRLLPALVPDRLEALMATGVIEACGPDRYCVPSPSLLQLTVDLLAIGYRPDRTLEVLTTIRRATDAVADAAVSLYADRPEGVDTDQLVALATRGRGLLAHGTGRLTIRAIGRRLGIEHEGSLPDALRHLLGVEDR